MSPTLTVNATLRTTRTEERHATNEVCGRWQDGMYFFPSLAPVTPFVLYSFRHTFLTRLGQSGSDAWTLARIAGHSSIAISSRNVHPSEDTVLAASPGLPGHNSGHSDLPTNAEGHDRKQLSRGEMYNYA